MHFNFCEGFGESASQSREGRGLSSFVYLVMFSFLPLIHPHYATTPQQPRVEQQWCLHCLGDMVHCEPEFYV